MRSRRFRAGGAALVTALVIAALTAAAAVAMASRTQLEIARTAFQIDAARRHALVARVEAEIRGGLRDETKTGQPAATPGNGSAREYSAREHDVTAGAAVRDEQRRFNLNNLAGIPRPSRGQSRVTTRATDSGGSTTNGHAAIPSTNASGSARPTVAANPESPAAPVSTDNVPTLSAGPEFVERTRLVLDPSVAKLVAGRGRPSELAALVAQGGTPRVSETYLERVEPVTGEQAAERTDDGIADVADADPSAHNPVVRTQTRAGSETAAGAIPDTAAASAAPVSAQALWALRLSLLLNHLDIEAAVAQAILDWVDGDSEARFPNGAEDAYYMRLDTPYRAANRPFTDVSELLLVRGVTPEVYARLRPFVTVLPGETAININTAPAELLMSLAPGIDRRMADLMIAARDVQAFRSTADLLAMPMLAMSAIDETGLDVDSEFFTATTTLASGADVEHSRALIARARNGRTRVVSRHHGYFND